MPLRKKSCPGPLLHHHPFSIKERLIPVFFPFLHLAIHISLPLCEFVYVPSTPADSSEMYPVRSLLDVTPQFSLRCFSDPPFVSFFSIPLSTWFRLHPTWAFPPPRRSWPGLRREVFLGPSLPFSYHPPPNSFIQFNLHRPLFAYFWCSTPPPIRPIGNSQDSCQC